MNRAPEFVDLPEATHEVIHKATSEALSEALSVERIWGHGAHMGSQSAYGVTHMGSGLLLSYLSKILRIK